MSVVIVLVLVCVFAGGALSAGCYPCASTCGSLSGWHVAGEGSCFEVRYHQCLNNQCTTYNPLYDDCNVYCKWERWADALDQNDCIQFYYKTTFCTQ